MLLIEGRGCRHDWVGACHFPAKLALSSSHHFVNTWYDMFHHRRDAQVARWSASVLDGDSEMDTIVAEARTQVQCLFTVGLFAGWTDFNQNSYAGGYVVE